MNNSEVLELRKRLKKEDNTITKLTGCYVIGMEKQIRTYIDTTLDERDAGQFICKHYRQLQDSRELSYFIDS